MGENACCRGQNQRSGTFYGVSNFRGLGCFSLNKIPEIGITVISGRLPASNLSILH